MLFFLFLALCSLCFLFNPDTTAAGIFGLLFSAVFLCIFYYSKKQSDNSSTSNYKNIEKKYNHALGNLINQMSKINHDYALGLTEVDLLEIAGTDHPFDIIAAKITLGYPTVPDFLHNTNHMITLLSEEMNLSVEQCAKVTFHFIHELTPSVTNEAIQEIADNFSAQLSPEFYFLKNKINYELSTLGMIMGVAQRNGDYNLQQKVQNLRKKRGYI